jgi:ubiquitin-protein ligase
MGFRRIGRALVARAHGRINCASSPYDWLCARHIYSLFSTKLLSVISLLSADPPNLDSPANVDAAKQVREDLPSYKKKVRRLVRKSAEEAFD